VLPTTLANFILRCEVQLADEQAKASPDNALVALLCDAVRMAREFCERQATPPTQAEP